MLRLCLHSTRYVFSFTLRKTNGCHLKRIRRHCLKLMAHWKHGVVT
jgi:hypothetical protein